MGVTPSMLIPARMRLLRLPDDEYSNAMNTTELLNPGQVLKPSPEEWRQWIRAQVSNATCYNEATDSGAGSALLLIAQSN